MPVAGKGRTDSHRRPVPKENHSPPPPGSKFLTKQTTDLVAEVLRTLNPLTNFLQASLICTQPFGDCRPDTHDPLGRCGGFPTSHL